MHSLSKIIVFLFCFYKPWIDFWVNNNRLRQKKLSEFRALFFSTKEKEKILVLPPHAAYKTERSTRLDLNCSYNTLEFGFLVFCFYWNDERPNQNNNHPASGEEKNEIHRNGGGRSVEGRCRSHGEREPEQGWNLPRETRNRRNETKRRVVKRIGDSGEGDSATEETF